MNYFWGGKGVTSNKRDLHPFAENSVLPRLSKPDSYGHCVVKSNKSHEAGTDRLPAEVVEPL